MESKVTYSKFAEKQMNKVPKHIKEALLLWASTVHKIGIEEVKKLKDTTMSLCLVKDVVRDR